MMFVITLSDIVGITLFTLFILVFVGLSIAEWIKQKRCGHDSYRENQRCHAVCVSCSKDLGFVQLIREDKTKHEVH